MSRRRDIRPPFEVMKGSAQAASSGSQSSGPPLSVAPSADGGASSGSGHGRTGGHGGADGRDGGVTGGENWSRLRQPLVFRLPPGYAVLIVLGVLILLVVAYSAGYSQGGSRTAAKLEAQANEEQSMASRLGQGGDGRNAVGREHNVSVAGSNVGSSGATAAGQSPSPAVDGALHGVYDDVAMDPRKPNYQYFILAHCSKEEAGRLVTFFGERGVEAAAVISHNRRSQYVVFVLRPFTREQTASPEARELKLKIFEWGKVWASRKYRGPTNLSDTYLAVYQPKEN